MKIKLLLFTVFFAPILAFAQCEVMTDFGDADFGLAPDSVVDFAPATINSLYVQQLDVKIPADGTFLGFSFVTVDSASLASISNLPPGINFECNSPLITPCTFLASSTGCGVLSGIPTQAGVFDLVITANFYTNLGTEPTGVPLVGYRIVVSDPLSVNDAANLDFSEIVLAPNPASDLFKIQTNAKKSGAGVFRIYDLLGQEVLVKNLSLKAGSNSFAVPTSELNEGVYITRLDAFGHSRTVRLVVVK